MKTPKWTALIVLGSAAVLWAQPMAPVPAPMLAEPEHGLLEQAPPPIPGLAGLDLSPEQHEKLDKLQMSFLKETMPLGTDIRIKEMELAALWRADKLDTKSIVAKVKEIAEVRTRLEVARVMHQIDVYNILTPDQQSKVRKMLARGRGRFAGGWPRVFQPGMLRQHRGRCDRPHGIEPPDSD
ncbi:MAG: Spy/CpxP family protein refolding chaperone [candidate division WOR-3 bacterium]